MPKSDSVKINVDAGRQTGPLKHDWRYIGYDECNYTHTPEGEQLIAKFGALKDAPYFMRTHHLFCTGNCHGTYKWGSTNVYTEDPTGKPIYDWTVIDSIIDVYLRNSAKPFFEIGFMPMDLADPRFAPNGYGFKDYRAYRDIGWACPPKDYEKWYELVRNVALHCVERYGRDEVLSWYWELWNEPDIFYWRGTVEEYCRLYDYTEAAVHAVLPEARLSGPATCGPTPGNHGHEFLSKFLDHCSRGQNYVSGAQGTRLDFITFHVKGGGFPFDVHASKATPSVHRQISQVKMGLETIRDHGYGALEVVLSEADPDGWAAGGRFDNANLNFRNTEYYASYVASSYQQIRNLGAVMGMDVRPLAWAFMFVGERCFEGTRTFSTQGIDKAVFNLFKMFARLGDTQCRFESSHRMDAWSIPSGPGERQVFEVSGLATGGGSGGLSVLIYAHHDDWDNNDVHSVEVELRGLATAKKYRTRHYRIDSEHSNAYAEWVRHGRPAYPSSDQREAINARSGLDQIETLDTTSTAEGAIHLSIMLPSHAVSLLEVE